MTPTTDGGGDGVTTMAAAVKRVSGSRDFRQSPLWRQDAHPATSWAAASPGMRIRRALFGMEPQHAGGARRPLSVDLGATAPGFSSTPMAGTPVSAIGVSVLLVG